MPDKIVLELSPSQLTQLIDRLPIKAKIRLVRRLEDTTWANRLDSVVKQIRRRISQAKISDKEIDRLCEEVKREYDEKHRRN